MNVNSPAKAAVKAVFSDAQYHFELGREIAYSTISKEQAWLNAEKMVKKFACTNVNF